MVGAESGICPRCGVSFRAAMIRRAMTWTALVGVTAWTLGHYVHHHLR